MTVGTLTFTAMDAMTFAKTFPDSIRWVRTRSRSGLQNRELIAGSMRFQRDLLPEDSEDRPAFDRMIERFEAGGQNLARDDQRFLREITEPILRDREADDTVPPFPGNLDQDSDVLY